MFFVIERCLFGFILFFNFHSCIMYTHICDIDFDKYYEVSKFSIMNACIYSMLMMVLLEMKIYSSEDCKLLGIFKFYV